MEEVQLTFGTAIYQYWKLINKNIKYINNEKDIIPHSFIGIVNA